MTGRLGHRPLTPHLFAAPALAVLVVFVGAPFALVVYLSFTHFTAFSDSPTWVGLANYREALDSDRFWACMANTAAYLLVTPVLAGLSLTAAMIVRTGLRGAGVLRVMLFLPVVTPAIVGALAWQLLLKDHGLLNSLLEMLGISPVPWLSRRPWTLISPMLVTLWKGFGFYMMIFLAGLIAVPRELEEAAAIDGGGRWTVFRHVVLPAIWPVVVLVSVVSSISALKVFDEIFVTVKGVPIEHQTIVPLVFNTAFEARGGDHGLASAIGILLFLVILAFSLVNMRLVQRRTRRASGAGGGGT